MTHETPLPPNLQQFISEQLAIGHFESEGEVIRTALHLLEERFHSQEACGDWLKQELDKGLESRPSEPITKEFWNQLRARIRAGQALGNDS